MPTAVKCKLPLILLLLSFFRLTKNVFFRFLQLPVLACEK